MGKSTISMAIFNSFLYVYQAGYSRLLLHGVIIFGPKCWWIIHIGRTAQWHPMAIWPWRWAIHFDAVKMERVYPLKWPSNCSNIDIPLKLDGFFIGSALYYRYSIGIGWFWIGSAPILSSNTKPSWGSMMAIQPTATPLLTSQARQQIKRDMAAVR